MKERESSIKETMEFPKIFLEPWPELPANFVSVYHYRSKESLESIARNGITHFSERMHDEEMSLTQKAHMQFEKYCDELARELGIDFKRSKAVFAALPPEIDIANWSRFGEIRLELKVDPDETFVYDRALHSAAVFAFYRTPEGKNQLDNDPNFAPGSENRKKLEEETVKYQKEYKHYLKEYLLKRVRFSDFLKMDTEERQKNDKSSGSWNSWSCAARENSVKSDLSLWTSRLSS